MERANGTPRAILDDKSLTLLTKSAHPALWTGAGVGPLAHTSVLAMQPTHRCRRRHTHTDTFFTSSIDGKKRN